MIDLQKMLDAMAHSDMETRANYHLTLGGLLEALGTAPDAMTVEFDTGGSPCRPHSYRGYYSDLALEKTSDTVTVASLRREADGALGNTFEGYKGGDFTMSERTPLWNAYYGSCGSAIVDAAISDGKLVLSTKEIGR